MRFPHLLTAALVAATSLSAAHTASAQDVAKFYKSKRIQILVGSGPGGGYDTYARMLSRHMGRHIPGKPRFLVKNMDGAGSIVMANYVFNVAPQDGTVIAGLQRNAAMVEIMGQKGPKFKASDINWLGSLADEAGACAIATRTNIKSFDEVFTRVFVMGGTGPNDTEINPALMNNALGAKFRLIKGYPSTPPIHLAIERGEVDGVCQSWASLSEQGRDGLMKGTLKPVIQLSIKPVPALTKMGVPTIFDVINTGRHLAPGISKDDATAYFNMLMGVRVMGRPFALAPKVPADRVKAMRVAFVDTTKDPKFLAEAKKLGRDVELVTGEEIQDIVAKMSATPKPLLAKLDDLLKFKGPTKTAELDLPKHSGKITKIDGGGRKLTLDEGGKSITAGVSGSRTKIFIGGKKAGRGDVKVGMNCTFELPMPKAKEAVKVDCKG
jgi:tripartite-type tricarboxylate transporter receptor subunit TctC